MQFLSAEFIFKQPEMLNEQSVPIRYSRNVQTTSRKYSTLQIGYRSEAPFGEIAEFNKTLDTLKQTAMTMNIITIPIPIPQLTLCVCQP